MAYIELARVIVPEILIFDGLSPICEGFLANKTR